MDAEAELLIGVSEGKVSLFLPHKTTKYNYYNNAKERPQSDISLQVERPTLIIERFIFSHSNNNIDIIEIVQAKVKFSGKIMTYSFG